MLGKCWAANSGSTTRYQRLRYLTGSKIRKNYPQTYQL